MNFSKLKKEVYDANMLLPKFKLVIHTWGNVSQKSQCGNYFAIKPSGVSYDLLKPEDIVVLDMNGKKVDGNLKPSIDTPIHLAFYKEWKDIKAICHTHSPFAVAWASIGENIPPYSTVHADYFYGEIPVSRDMVASEFKDPTMFEHNTALTIIEAFKNRDYKATPAALAKSHGPFIWSTKNAHDVVMLAQTLEELAKIAYYTKTLKHDALPAARYIQKAHYDRKHGLNSTYGQKSKL